MDKTVQLRVANNYGNQTLYPINEAAHLFAQIAGTKTLTIPTIKHIMALGYTVEYHHDTVVI